MLRAHPTLLDSLTRFQEGDPLAFSGAHMSEEALGRLRRTQVDNAQQDPLAIIAIGALYCVAFCSLAQTQPNFAYLCGWTVAYVGFLALRYPMIRQIYSECLDKSALPKSYTFLTLAIAGQCALFLGAGAAIGFADASPATTAPLALIYSLNISVCPVLFMGASLLHSLFYLVPCLLGALLGLALNGGAETFAMASIFVVLSLFALTTSFNVTRRLAKSVMAQFEAERTARADVLTGLGNRKGFEERLQQSVCALQERKEPFALALFDLNGLKRVNDLHGHAAGDALIRHMAKVLAAHARANTDFVARLGGDEFVALLNEADDAAAVAAVRRIVAAFREPVDLGWGPLSPTTSVGLALAPRDGADAQKLLRAADAAMYFHKKQGIVGLSAVVSSSDLPSDPFDARAA